MLARPRFRQLTLGELLDESFRIYRRDLLTLIALAALVIVPYTIINFLISLPLQQDLAQLQQGAIPGGVPEEDLFASFFAGTLYTVGISWLLNLLYIVVFQPLMEGSLTRAVTRRYLDQPVSVGDSIGAALRNALSLIVAKLLPSLLFLVVGGLFFVCSFAALGGLAVGGAALAGDSEAAGVGTGIAFVLGFFVLLILFLVAAALVFIRFLFTSQTIIAEGQGPIEALRRSWNLTKDYFWRTLGFVIVIGLISALVQLVPTSIISGILGVMVVTGQGDFVTQQLISTIASAIAQVLVTPFVLIAYTLMYFDLRIRKEGFDLEHQAQSLLAEGRNPGYTQPFGS